MIRISLKKDVATEQFLEQTDGKTVQKLWLLGYEIEKFTNGLAVTKIGQSFGKDVFEIPEIPEDLIEEVHIFNLLENVPRSAAKMTCTDSRGAVAVYEPILQLEEISAPTIEGAKNMLKNFWDFSTRKEMKHKEVPIYI